MPDMDLPGTFFTAVLLTALVLTGQAAEADRNVHEVAVETVAAERPIYARIRGVDRTPARARISGILSELPPCSSA